MRCSKRRRSAPSPTINSVTSMSMELRQRDPGVEELIQPLAWNECGARKTNSKNRECPVSLAKHSAHRAIIGCRTNRFQCPHDFKHLALRGAEAFDVPSPLPRPFTRYALGTWRMMRRTQRSARVRSLSVCGVPSNRTSSGRRRSQEYKEAISVRLPNSPEIMISGLKSPQIPN